MSMSKKRYACVQELLRGVLQDDDKAAAVLAQICNIIHYNPNAPTYTPEQGQKAKENRHRRAAERGVSTYITSGAKSAYEKRKRERAAASSASSDDVDPQQ